MNQDETPFVGDIGSEINNAEQRAAEESRVINLFEDPEDYFAARRVAIESRMTELEERLNNVSYDEEGQLLGEIEKSRYFKPAEQSMDSMNLFVLKSDIERLELDSDEYRKKRETEKADLKTANDLLKIEQSKLEVIEEELNKIHVEMLSADNEALVENSKRLEEKRAERDNRISVISYLNNEVQQITTSIANNAPIIRRNIRMNNQLIKNLKQEIEKINSKENIDYFDYERFDRDLKELKELKVMLEHINSYSKDKAKTKEQNSAPIVEQPIVPQSGEPVVQPVVPQSEQPVAQPVVPLSEEPVAAPEKPPIAKPIDEPLVLPGESPTMPKDNPEVTGGPYRWVPERQNPIPEFGDYSQKKPSQDSSGSIIEIPSRQSVTPMWSDEIVETPPISMPEMSSISYSNVIDTMDGFKLDFIEKFGYVPGDRERALNPNYNSDTSTLVCGVEAAYNRDIAEYKRIRREQVVARITSVPRHVFDSIRAFVNKNFLNRREPENNPDINIK